MAVRLTTVPADERGDPRGPTRTCIGCRRRAAAAELLRVVVAPAIVESAEPGGQRPGNPLLAVPDPRRRAPGRGAWLHPDPGCAGLAERRRAFGRALRVPAGVDPSPIIEYVARLAGNAGSARNAPPMQ